MLVAHAYAARYCEENVWRLLRDGALAGRPACAVVISNEARACPMWLQRTAIDAGWPVVWDFHVVAVAAGDPPAVWDMDSMLSLPTDLESYLEGTFPLQDELDEAEQPRFRVVPGPEYVRGLCSDRSHMRGPDGRWLAPPPPWEPPLADGCLPNVMRLVDPGDDVLGSRCDLAGLRQVVQTTLEALGGRPVIR